jgi:hypothetical protein
VVKINEHFFFNFTLKIYKSQIKMDQDQKQVQKNNIKEIETQLLEAINFLMQENKADKRWLSIAKTHIEEGVMAINRAIYTPK